MNVAHLKLQQELLKLLTKDISKQGIFYLNDSKTWYMTDEQAKTYLALGERDDVYAKRMLSAEYSFLQEHISEFTDVLPDEYLCADLGPGYPDKTKFIMQESIQEGKDVSYAAIDISPYILNVVEQTIQPLAIDRSAFVGDFTSKEEFPLFYKQIKNIPKFFYLGETLGNYDTSTLLSFYHRNIQSDDLFYFSMQEQPQDINIILEQYSPEFYLDGFDVPVAQLGLDSKKLQTRYNYETYDIETYVEVEEIPELLKDTNVKEGDEIVFFTSKKPTREYFQKHISQYFQGNYFYDKGFMGFIGKKK